MVWGFNGNDAVLYGGTGNDTLYGGRGDDSMGGEGTCDQDHTAPDGDDALDDGPGEDQLSDGSSGNDTLKDGTEHDELHASSGNDILRGGELVDDMWGGYGDDTLYGSGDDGFSDYLNCQEGTNDVAYAGAGDRVSWSCEKVIKSGKIQRF
jgi:Ca2+-binding RTX toxin-like protein